MTTLNSTEIKGIISEKGINCFNVIVTVPNNIFAVNKSTQHAMISTAAVGFEMDIVHEFSFYENSKINGMVELHAIVEFTEEAIATLERLEFEKAEGSKKAIDIVGSLEFDNLVLLASQGINTFRTKLPANYPQRIRNVQESLATSAISQSFFLKGIIVTVLAETEAGIRAELHVPNLIPQIEAYQKKKAASEEIYRSIEGYGTVRLLKPLNQEELNEVLLEKVESGDSEFSYLIELSYDEIVDLDNIAINELLAEYIIEDNAHEYLKGIEHTVVGFNPTTNNLIMKVTGEYGISANDGCLL